MMENNYKIVPLYLELYEVLSPDHTELKKKYTLSDPTIDSSLGQVRYMGEGENSHKQIVLSMADLSLLYNEGYAIPYQNNPMVSPTYIVFSEDHTGKYRPWQFVKHYVLQKEQLISTIVERNKVIANPTGFAPMTDEKATEKKLTRFYDNQIYNIIKGMLNL